VLLFEGFPFAKSLPLSTTSVFEKRRPERKEKQKNKRIAISDPTTLLDPLFIEDLLGDPIEDLLEDPIRFFFRSKVFNFSRVFIGKKESFCEGDRPAIMKNATVRAPTGAESLAPLKLKQFYFLPLSLFVLFVWGEEVSERTSVSPHQ
jgi:hypothetical protein